MTLHEILIEGICAFEVFRQLGFPSEDIYFAAHTDDVPPTVSLAVKRGGKMFTLALGPRPKGIDDKEIEKEWTTLANDYNAGKWDPGFHDIFYGSRARSQAVNIIMALTAKGMYPP